MGALKKKVCLLGRPLKSFYQRLPWAALFGVGRVNAVWGWGDLGRGLSRMGSVAVGGGEQALSRKPHPTSQGDLF